MNLSAPLRQALEEDPGVTLVLELDHSIAFTNRQWAISAGLDGCQSNTLGHCYLDFVAGELKARVAEALEQAGAMSSGFESTFLHSECNTDVLRRKLTSRFAALRKDGSEGEAFGLLVQHTLRVVGPLREAYTLVEAPIDSFRDSKQVITQCGCCRRVRDPETGGWVMCLALIRHPDKGITHGLCKACLETYYPA